MQKRRTKPNAPVGRTDEAETDGRDCRHVQGCAGKVCGAPAGCPWAPCDPPGPPLDLVDIGWRPRARAYAIATASHYLVDIGARGYAIATASHYLVDIGARGYAIATASHYLVDIGARGYAIATASHYLVDIGARGYAIATASHYLVDIGARGYAIATASHVCTPAPHCSAPCAGGGSAVGHQFSFTLSTR
eukprot:1195140-Prorocentrum_minimum.AAC.4